MREAVNSLFGHHKLPLPIQGAISKMLVLDRLNELVARIRLIPGDLSFCERLLSGLEIQPQIAAADLARIPKRGGVVAVANHPFGMIEGPLVGATLPRIRPDVRILTNRLLSAFPELHELCFFVDPFGTQEALKSNLKSMKQALLWLKDGGMLVIFPAGEVAHLDLKRRRITDPPWNAAAARLARLTGAAVLPMYFHGNNSPLFQLLGLVHPRLRTALLPHEFLNKQHATLELRIGNAIPAKKILSFSSDDELNAYLRRRTYLLEGRQTKTPRPPLPFLPKRADKTGLEDLAAPVDPGLLESEIKALPPECVVAESGEFQVVLARTGEIHWALREIGRLRELTFRQTGEGTGKRLDLDGFDQHYLHLFVWNRDHREIAGAYRLGPSDELTAKFGAKGLYTSTLFAYKRQFLSRVRPALEIGRSFVRPEYQKSYAPLLLLWKGIGQFVLRHPQYRLLFGPVSISNEYNAGSRELMVECLKNHSQFKDLTRMVRARSPFRTRPLRTLDNPPSGSGTAAVWDIDELSALVSDIELDRKGLPILLKQYLKLGGKIVAFNLDHNFADALDGLIVVDLVQTDRQVLERYMGKEGAAEFLNHHRDSYGARRPA